MSGFQSRNEPVLRLIDDPPPSWVCACFVCHRPLRLGVALGRTGDEHWLCVRCIDIAAAMTREVRQRGERSAASDEDLTSAGGGHEE